VPYGAFVGVIPEWHPTLFKIVNWLAGAGTGQIDYTIDYTLKRIAERKDEEKSAKKDMLAQFLTSTIVDCFADAKTFLIRAYRRRSVKEA
jgi:hypothetical protein